MKLISIHIPKTAGTSFYNILQQVYGPEVSISFKRRDIIPLLQKGGVQKAHLSPAVEVLHGHFYYQEVTNLHLTTNAKLICWLRDPIDRLLSNYQYFKAGLLNPERNPAQYIKNKHRIDESILEFAALAENRNRMHSFLSGLAPEQLFFYGFTAYFNEDVKRLGSLLNWPPVAIKKLNEGAPYTKHPAIGRKLRLQLEELNQKDIELYRLFQAQSAYHE